MSSQAENHIHTKKHDQAFFSNARVRELGDIRKHKISYVTRFLGFEPDLHLEVVIGN